MNLFSRKDPNRLSLGEAAAYARSRIYLSLNYYLYSPAIDWLRIDVETIAIEVAQDALRTEKKQKEPTSETPYKIRPSAAFLVSKFTFNLLKPYKARLKGMFLTGELVLNERTLNIWFLEHLLDMALFLKWYHAAVAVLKILFICEFEEFKNLADRLDYASDSYPSEAKLRDIKKRMIDELNKWFKGIVILEEIKVGSKTELHFRRPPAPAQNLDFAANTLRKTRPVKPGCTLHDKSGLELLKEIERLKRQRAPNDFADDTEREIMQFLTCPDCLFSTFEALRLDHLSRGEKLFGNWRDKLGLPAYIIPLSGVGQSTSSLGGGSEGTLSIGQRPLDKSDEGDKTSFKRKLTWREKKILRQRDRRRRNLPLDFVFIVIDNGDPIELLLDGPRSRRIPLREGDSIIEVRGEDAEGSLPIDYHYVGWDPQLDEHKDYFFVTKLRNGRRLKFKLNYQRDEETGDLVSATLDVTYSEGKISLKVPHPQPAPKPRAQNLATYGIAAGIALVGVVGLVAYNSWSQQSNPTPAHIPQYGSPSNNNQRAEVMPAPSVSPTTPLPLTPISTSTPVVGKKPRRVWGCGNGLAKPEKRDRQGSPSTPEVKPRPNSIPPPAMITSNQREVGNPMAQANVTPATAPSPTPLLPNRQDDNDGAQDDADGNVASGAAPPKGVAAMGSVNTSVAMVTEGPEEASIRGRVILKDSGRGLSGVSLTIADLGSGEKFEINSDEDGFYTFSGPKDRDYKITVPEGRFRKYEEHVKIREGVKQRDVVLEEVSNSAAGVVTSAPSERENSDYVEGAISTPASTRTMNRPYVWRNGSWHQVNRNVSESLERLFSGRVPAERPDRVNSLALDKGRVIQVFLSESLNSRASRVGDAVNTVVAKPVYAGNVEVIPEGSIIAGSVSRVSSAAEIGGNGIIAVQFHQLRLSDGTKRDVKISLRRCFPQSPNADDSGPGSARLPGRRREMVFVGDEEKGFRIVPADEANPAPGPFASGNLARRRPARPIYSDADVKQSTEFCVALDESVSLRASTSK